MCYRLVIGKEGDPWEYTKIDLNNVPRKTDDIDLLNGAGSDRWELVGITTNNIAFLKRLIEEPGPSKQRPKPGSAGRDA